MRTTFTRLYPPVLLLVLLLLTLQFWPWLAGLLGLPVGDGTNLNQAVIWLTLATWLAGAWGIVRLLHVGLWEGVVHRRTGTPAPPLLTALVSLLIWISAALIVLTFVFHLPVAGFVATSGVAFAFAGLSSRNVVSDAAAGIGLAFDRVVGIGDWAEVRGHIGQVIAMSWRSTTLRRGNGLLVTLSNSQMAEATLVVYRSWRDEFDVELDYDVPPDQVDRILLAAAAEVIPPLDPPVPGRVSSVRLIAFTPTGVQWRLAYWVPDYPTGFILRNALPRAVLRNLTVAGLRPARLSQQLTVDRKSYDGGTTVPVAGVIGRIALFDSLTAEEHVRLADATTLRMVRAGAFVVQEGEAGQSMFIIREGLFDVMIGANNWPVARMSAGDFFGEMSLLTGAPRATSVRAASDAVLIEIGHDALMPLLAEREGLLERLSAALEERMGRNLAASAAQRVAAESPGAKAARRLQVLSTIKQFFRLQNNK